MIPLDWSFRHWQFNLCRSASTIRFVYSTVLLTSLLGVAGLQAQARDDIRIGARVRVEVPGTKRPTRLVGTLVSQTTDTLHPQLDRSKEIVAGPISQTRKLEVSLEQHSGAGRGATTGLMLGSLMGLVLGAGCDCGEPAAAAVVSSGILGGLGTALGALVGQGARVDEWTPVTPPPTRTPVSLTLVQVPFQEDVMRAPHAGMSLLLVGCASWQPHGLTPQAVIERDHPAQIRITRQDSSRVELSAPVIRGDSIPGQAKSGETTVALADISYVSLNRGSTVGIAALTGLGIAAGLITLIAATWNQ